MKSIQTSPLSGRTWFAPAGVTEVTINGNAGGAVGTAVGDNVVVTRSVSVQPGQGYLITLGTSGGGSGGTTSFGTLVVMKSLNSTTGAAGALTIIWEQ